MQERSDVVAKITLLKCDLCGREFRSDNLQQAHIQRDFGKVTLSFEKCYSIQRDVSVNDCCGECSRDLYYAINDAKQKLMLKAGKVVGFQ